MIQQVKFILAEIFLQPHWKAFLSSRWFWQRVAKFLEIPVAILNVGITSNHRISNKNQDNFVALRFYTLGGRTSYRKLLWSIEALRNGSRLLKFQSDTTIIISNLSAPRFHDLAVRCLTA